MNTHHTPKDEKEARNPFALLLLVGWLSVIIDIFFI